MKPPLSKPDKMGNLILIILHLSAWISLGTTAIYKKDYSIFSDMGRSLVIVSSFGYVGVLMVLLQKDYYFLWKNFYMRIFFFVCSVLLIAGVLLLVN